jgi:hypothetical protein
MSHLTLLFPSQPQEMMTGFEASREAEQDVFTRPDAWERAWTRSEDAADDYRLRSGIVSMEHWLDLNA